MYYDVAVCDFRPGMEVESFYILRTAQPKVSNNGKPYLNAVIADATGEIDAKVWDYAGPIGPGDEGKVIKIRGVVSEFRGTPQITLERLRLANDNDTYEMADLVPTAPIDIDGWFEELKQYVDSIEDRDYLAVCQRALERHGDAIRDIPAAKSVHHGFLSGLLMHTLNMLRVADFLADIYSGTVDRSLLLAGAFLHDIGKRWEFNFSNLGLVSDYSVKGELLGHLVMGAAEAADICRELDVPEDKSVLLQHLLLSHHGEPEHGAAVRPMCAEAELLSSIDLIDSRMEIYRENLDKLEPGQFSQRIFALDKKIYKHSELMTGRGESYEK